MTAEPIILDIETRPDPSPDALERIAAGIRPPANYSKPETIAKWEEEVKPGLVDEEWRKTAFDGGAGRLIVIGTLCDGEISQYAGDDETNSIARFFSLFDNLRGQPLIVGHNVLWDLRFIWKRAKCLDVTVPGWFTRAVRAKPWDSAVVFDTMTQWDDRNKVSLDALCRMLGIESPKTGMTGAGVYDAWKAGKLDEILEYNAGDLRATLQVYERLR